MNINQEALALEYYRIQKRYETISTVIRYTAYVVITYFVYLAIAQLAGKNTVANFLIELITSREKRSFTPWILLVCAIIWIYIERLLRKKNIVYYTSRIKQLEEIINKDRTSSNLNHYGENKPEDEI